VRVVTTDDRLMHKEISAYCHNRFPGLVKNEHRINTSTNSAGISSKPQI